MAQVKRSDNARNRSVVILPDGRPLKYLLQKRERDPYWLVRYRGLDGRRVEKSTSETSKAKAGVAAAALIRAAYQPRASRPALSWDEVLEFVVQHGKDNNLRPATTKSYGDMIRLVRAAFPGVHGPANLTVKDAERFKSIRLGKKKSPNTVAGNLKKLQILFRKLEIEPNPFEAVKPPKTDKPSPRVITPKEQEIFFKWMSLRWSGWRLPLLLLEVKAAVGCRIGELSELRSDFLQDGRLVFHATTSKGRKTRQSKPPQNLYEELKRLAGPRYVFESFSEQLRDFHRANGHHNHAASVRDFAPTRLVSWLEDEVQRFRKAHPEVRKFKLHNFRGTSMSRAKVAGVSYDDAAVAFGCHPETMRKHYIDLDETMISDSVFDRIGGETVENPGIAQHGSVAKPL